MPDYTEETWNTGDTFEAADATEMSRELEEQEEKDTDQDAAIAALQAADTALDGRVTALESSSVSQGTDIDSLQTSITAVQDDVTSVQTDIGALQTNDAAQDLAISDAAGRQEKTILTAAGDLYVATGAGTVVRLPIGTNGQVLRVDTTLPEKLKYDDESASGSIADDEVEFTNKRITKRVGIITSDSPNPTFNTDDFDVIEINGQTNTIASMSTNVTGSPNNWDELTIAITGTASVDITEWGDKFEAGPGGALPVATTDTDRLECHFEYRSGTSAWRLVWQGSSA